MKNKIITTMLLVMTMVVSSGCSYMGLKSTENKIPVIEENIQNNSDKEVEYEVFISKMEELGYEDGIKLVLGEKFSEEALKEKGLKHLETYNSFKSQEAESLPKDFSIINYMKLDDTKSFQDLKNLVEVEFPDFMSWAYVGENNIFGEQIITNPDVPDMVGSTSIISAIGSTYIIIDTSNPEQAKELLKEIGMPCSK